jgi:hypothetical protein
VRSAEHDDEAGEQLLKTESDALLAWLTTQPATMAGVIATLKHATRGPRSAMELHIGVMKCTFS